MALRSRSGIRRPRPAAIGVVLFALLSFALFGWHVRTGIRHAPGYDFRLRYHEAECLRQGIDPYDVVAKIHPTGEFALFCDPAIDHGAKALHVYTPWEYAFFLPFTLLPIRTAGILYVVLSAAALAAIAAWAFRTGRGIRGDPFDGLFAAGAAILLGESMCEVFTVANYGALNALFILLLAMALEARRDVLAGFCWAFLMFKPQIGLLFAVPLFLSRRFLAMGTAVALCLAASLPASLACGKTPPEMVFEVPRACAFVAEDNGTMLIPSQAFAALRDRIDPSLLGLASMAIGGTICLVLVWRLRKEESWFVRLAPVAVCAILWSYCKPHDRVILWLPQLLVAVAALRSRRPRAFALCILVCILAAWPFVQDSGPLTKLLRRVSLAAFLVFCWFLPRLRPLPGPAPLNPSTERPLRT